MKKQKLIVDFEFDFDVFGIVSTFKDYKLAWNINKSLNISLQKKNDIAIKFVDSELVVSHFSYSTESLMFQLIRNKSFKQLGGENQYLIPELPKMDYFVMVNGEFGDWDHNSVQNKLRKTTGIEFVTKLEIEKLKSRENFIF